MSEFDELIALAKGVSGFSDAPMALQKVNPGVGVATLQINGIEDLTETTVKGLYSEVLQSLETSSIVLSQYQVILGTEDYEEAIAKFQEHKRLLNILEKTRKAAKDPFLQAGKLIDSVAKDIAEKNGFEAVEKAIVKYGKEAEKLRKQELEKIEAELKSKIENEPEKALDFAITAQVKTQSIAEVAQTKTAYKARVTNWFQAGFKLLSYFLSNGGNRQALENLLLSALPKDGSVNIPGVIYEEVTEVKVKANRI